MYKSTVNVYAYIARLYIKMLLLSLDVHVYIKHLNSNYYVEN